LTEDLLPVGGLVRIPLDRLSGGRLLPVDWKPRKECGDVQPAEPKRPITFPGADLALSQDKGTGPGGRPVNTILGIERARLYFRIDTLDDIVTDYWRKVGYGGGGTSAPPVEGAYVDCLPVDDRTLLLFLAWQGELRAWRMEWSDPHDPKRVRVKYTQEPALRVAADIREPFTLYGSPSRLFVVTESGRLYGCRDADKGGQKLKLLWDDKRRPIRLVLSDADSGKDFAFAPAPGGFGSAQSTVYASSVYFEIADKLVLTPYNAAALGEVKPQDPLKAVVAHARLLLDARKIRP
jgi:hypothetical protein